MTNEQDETPARPKKAYSKPRIRQVVLRPEEAVLGSCKTSTKSGPAQARCNFPSACRGHGS
jgi:hypothetical protein